MSENQSDSLLPVATVIKKSSLKDANKPYDAFVLTEDATVIGEISIKLDEEVAKEFYNNAIKNWQKFGTIKFLKFTTTT